MPTIDGGEWTEKRIAFLESMLDDDPPPEQRAAIEEELRDLKGSRSGWRRWLSIPRLPHQR